MFAATSAGAIDFLLPVELSGQIAKLSTIHRCERGDWPASIALLRAVEAGAIAAGHHPTTVPWSAISDADFDQRSGSSLLIRLVLTPNASTFGCSTSEREVTIVISNPECEAYQSGLSVVCGPAGEPE
jgi:hypothetical protein